jgi:hypothetical protein
MHMCQDTADLGWGILHVLLPWHLAVQMAAQQVCQWSWTALHHTYAPTTHSMQQKVCYIDLQPRSSTAKSQLGTQHAPDCIVAHKFQPHDAHKAPPSNHLRTQQLQHAAFKD